ncbi:hypothetical protein [Cesiribacter sp. SM1]|uniref:pPIWI-associating nuclease domain-containing protein n=1 Tax=Cesiribacter sp. SM1 TaxID=2861196 RepID=UPI001CD1CA51|nr:hypothetical protein [Cesiribacter sp. SM1]
MEKQTGLNSALTDFTKVANQMNLIPDYLKEMIEFQNSFKSRLPSFEIPKFEFPKLSLPEFKPLINSELLDAINKISETAQSLKNHPELQFGFITDLEVLNLKSAEELKETLTHDLTVDDIKAKEDILNQNLLPYLEKLKLDSIWLGANYALDSESNPDKIRHCLISLRTILEYLIDHKLAPNSELKDSEMFKKEFKNYHLRKEPLEKVRIKRAKKIEYFTSKIRFGMLEEFTKKEIDYICECYTVLCNIHNPEIGITENQVRSLKVKTGITIWLLAYIHQILEN